ncbi:hypothetical protein KBX18_06785 [Corynebacterium sp. CCUG 69979]|uniref:hypothetical protein n=1 Tax=Corynebacterium sp. CCUG 69979 TaxID=2823890 RepID=UPI00210BD94B|nr:hypothetical protein [Corynebacterium sp. CCUG 69979]MCQ4625264.1 hypothetical protein [Corynebacterium sp. CCUG 69979]
METWSLRHPNYGLIEVRAGFDQEFRDIHSDWPSSSDDEKCGGTQLTADSSLVERAQSRFRNPRTRVEVLVDGRPNTASSNSNPTAFTCSSALPRKACQTNCAPWRPSVSTAANPT